jgi:signal transduction histidine kinase
MVVDDNADNRLLAQATLEDGGYRVALADNGDEALRFVDREPPDCVLMDIRMPGLDGIEACERIRQSGGADIAVVFVTAERTVANFDRAVGAGGDDFITKPYRPEELLLRVQTAMRLRKLAAERGDLTDQLRQQRDRLQRLELQKEELTAFLVHDLKNPVNSIALQAELVFRRPENAERARQAAARIKDETETLIRMLMNLLDLAKADEGRLTTRLQTVDAGALVREVASQIEPRAASQGVRIVAVPEDVSVQADRDLLARVVANLLDNALRHSPDDSEVRIWAVARPDAIEIAVADAGPGVPPERRDTVFERFHSGQAHGERTNRGLGLAFCKVAVEAHRGYISIDDGSPGAVFRIVLPSSTDPEGTP